MCAALLQPGTSGPWEIATGPDGNLWFTYINITFKRNVIGKITPSGVVTEFFVDIGSDNRPWGITAGSDGNMWFTAPGYVFSDGMIVRISPSGDVTKITDGITPLSSPQLALNVHELLFKDFGFQTD